MTKATKEDKIFSKSSPIKCRVMEYLEDKGLSKQSFYSETGISAANFKGDGLNSELGGDKIVKILTCYKDINPDWLILGNGSMTRESYYRNNVAKEAKEKYKPPDECKLCQEKERTIEAMRVANEALQTALSALKNSGRYSNSRESSTSKQTG